MNTVARTLPTGPQPKPAAPKSTKRNVSAGLPSRNVRAQATREEAVTSTRPVERATLECGTELEQLRAATADLRVVTMLVARLGSSAQEDADVVHGDLISLMMRIGDRVEAVHASLLERRTTVTNPPATRALANYADFAERLEDGTNTLQSALVVLEEESSASDPRFVDRHEGAWAQVHDAVRWLRHTAACMRAEDRWPLVREPREGA